MPRPMPSTVVAWALAVVCLASRKVRADAVTLVTRHCRAGCPTYAGRKVRADAVTPVSDGIVGQDARPTRVGRCGPMR